MTGAYLAWNWQPALYLFFGGLGAGMFIVAAFLFYRFRDTFKRAINLTAWIATISLGVGLLLLVLELTQPLRGLMLWQSFSSFSSWMAIGAWIVFAAVIVFGVSAVLTTDFLIKRIGFLEKLAALLNKFIFGIGAVLGLAVAIYTGILLLSAPGIPFWDTWLLPCLFTVSALDTGIAAVEIILLVQSKKKARAGLPNTADGEAARTPIHKVNVTLEIAVIALVVLELVLLAIYLYNMLDGGHFATSTATYATEAAAHTSAYSLLFGWLALLFWILVVAIGLLLPLLGSISGLLFKEKFGGINVLIGAAGALIGGCTLRFLVLYAGVHADYIGDAAYWLVY